MATPPAFRLTKNVTTRRCHWLNRDYKKGEIVYEFWGCTYGCISSDGDAFSENPGEGPFFELPLDAVERVEAPK